MSSPDLLCKRRFFTGVKPIANGRPPGTHFTTLRTGWFLKEQIMADKSGSTANKAHESGKVGSDRAADREIGGKGDFGIPAAQATAPQPIGGRDKGPEQGTGYTRSGASGVRESGVGYPPGGAGSGSGGDLDPDFIGLDGKGGLSASPASGRTTGPDITDGRDAFASGGPSRGENQLPAGTHGAPSQVVRGSTVDRSGGDASTTGAGMDSDSTESAASLSDRDVPDNAAAGEISSDEAGG
jgi:hypothetical protein